MPQKEGSIKLTKEKCVSPQTVSTAVIICGSMQLPHHKVIQQNAKHNTATTYTITDTNTKVSEHISAEMLWQSVLDWPLKTNRKRKAKTKTKTVCGISSILLLRRSDAESSVVRDIPAACVRAQLPSDGGPMLTGENYWQDSSWCPLTASDQSRQLIIQHLPSDSSRPPPPWSHLGYLK